MRNQMRHNLSVSHGLTCTLCNIYIYIYSDRKTRKKK